LKPASVQSPRQPMRTRNVTARGRGEVSYRGNAYRKRLGTPLPGLVRRSPGTVCDLVLPAQWGRRDTYPGDTPTLPVLLPSMKSMSNPRGCGLESAVTFCTL